MTAPSARMMLLPGSSAENYVFRLIADTQKACRDGYSAFYTRAAALFRDLVIARADGSLLGALTRFPSLGPA